MNLCRVTFSLSKYSGYVYNSFKQKFVDVRLLSSFHSQLWKSNKVNSSRKNKTTTTRGSNVSHGSRINGDDFRNKGASFQGVWDMFPREMF